MTFESPALTWWVTALLLIGLSVGLMLLLSRLFRIKSGCLPLLVLLAAAVLIVFGLSAFVDSAGKPAVAEVLDKRESLVYHADGSWNRKIVVDVRYSDSDSAQPVTESLTVLPARYDELHQGDFVQLRLANVSGFFRLTRLEDQKTLSQAWSRVWDQPFFFLFAVGLTLVLAARVIRRTGVAMVFFLTAFVTIGAWWLSGIVIPLWQQSDLLMGSLNSVSGTVREIHPPYLGSGLQNSLSNQIFTANDLVLMDMIPLGRSQSILAVDVIDHGSSNVRPGQPLNVEYSASNPRLAIVPDAARSFLWKNSLLGTFFALLALLGVARIAFLISERRQRPRPGRSGRRMVPV